MSCGIVTKQAEALGIKPGTNVLEDISHNLHGCGVSVKVTPLARGMKVIQHKHSYDHLGVLLTGRVIVQTDNDTCVLAADDGPMSIIIEADIYHSVTAVTDAVWQCVWLNPTGEVL